MKLVSYLILACSLLAAGCVTTQSDKMAAAHIAVSYATAKVIRNNPDYAARVIAISGAVRAVAGQEKFDTVALLDQFIRSQVRWEKLTPEDKLLADLLLTEIRRALEENLGTGIIPTDKLPLVSEVAGWIESAAKSVSPAQ